MRGSNGGKADPRHELPSYKWFAVSQDGGENWSTPAPWGFDDGQEFFSPSAMSALFRHSSGRCFWAGNLSAHNCEGNSPRWPLVLGEVDSRSLKLVHSSVLTVDTLLPEDKSHGRLDLSHLTLLEDRETKQIVLVYPRSYNAYKSNEWATIRMELEGEGRRKKAECRRRKGGRVVQTVKQILVLSQRVPNARTPQEKTGLERQVVATGTFVDHEVEVVHRIAKCHPARRNHLGQVGAVCAPGQVRGMTGRIGDLGWAEVGVVRLAGWVLQRVERGGQFIVFIVIVRFGVAEGIIDRRGAIPVVNDPCEQVAIATELTLLCV